MTGLDPLIERDMESGGTLVVPSSPRAASVLSAYAGVQLGKGRGAWRTPDVIAYRSWLEREAHRAADAGQAMPRPLRAAEEWLLWRQAAEAVVAEGFALDSLAESLHRAARRLFEWDIAPAVLRSAERGESRLLARALEYIETRTRDLQAVGSHQLVRLLRDWQPARPVTFAGFTECTPARRALLDAWAEGPTRHREHELAGIAPQAALAEDTTASVSGCVQAVRAADPEEELELAAAWCRDRLQRDAGDRVLIVIPDLARRRARILRVFRRVLSPRAVLSGSEEGLDLLAVEEGWPLGEEPTVRHALAALRFLIGGAELADVSAWLRGAFWTAPGAADRARLDAVLRQVLDPDVAPAALLAALHGVAGPMAGSAERLRAALEAALGAIGSGSAAPGEWSRRFERALRSLGWPGERPLSSREQPAVAQFGELLGDLAALGAHAGTLSGSAALRVLDALVDRRTLAPPSGPAAVTLTGVLDDPLVRYDGIWIAGLHADAWPAPVELDPFIPFAAQRRAGVVAADAGRRLAHAREVLRRCSQAAASVMASWPARGDQREYGPSPLLLELQGRSGGADWTAAAGTRARLPASTPVGIAQDAAEPPRGESLARQIRASRRMELFDDAVGEPWPARSPLPSGTRAIEYQSRCPFRAYAELRLSCVPLAAPRPGVGALDRGRLLHRALELLWRGLGGSELLAAEAAAGTLARRIEECVAAAADETLPVPADPAARAAQRRERRRAVQVLVELAELERRRPPFRVRSTELRRKIVIEGAALDVRIDRLDELEDGSCAVFDYKTGRAASPDWLAERIANPQLLVYALAAEERVTALAMIHLTPRHIAYRGMADRRERLPRIDAPPEPAQWLRQIERWERTVADLAREFLRGGAAVDPLGDACATCHLHGACRVAEIAAAAPEAVADADADADRRGRP